MSMNFDNHQNQDVEINITPIIDCFTVLITFLLASASFLSIGYFEASTPGNSMASNTTVPDTELVLKITENHDLQLNWKGKKSGRSTIHLDQDPNADQLDAELTKAKSENIRLEQILITADNAVPYKSISKVLDVSGKSGIPVVIGDFKE